MIRKRKRIVGLVLVLALGATTVCGGRQVYSDYRDNTAVDQIRAYKPSAAAAVNEIQEQRPAAVAAADQVRERGLSADGDGEEKFPGQPLMDFSGIQGVNNEIIAWLTIPDTVIDYPVAQTTNNDYYLHHDINKKSNANGTLFLDYRVRADFSGFNNVIYGHHMKSGRMFQSLIKFKEQAFFDKHAAGTLYTPDKTWRLEIFAVAVISADSELYQYALFSVNEKAAHLEAIKEQSLYYRDIDITADDRILMLSTCSFEYKDARTIVAARLV